MLTSTISGGEELRQVTYSGREFVILRTPEFQGGEELRHDFVKLQRFICFQPAAQPFPSSAKRFSSASSSWCATSAAPLTPKRSRQSSYLGCIVSITTVVSRFHPCGEPPFLDKFPHWKCPNSKHVCIDRKLMKIVNICPKHQRGYEIEGCL